MCTDFQNKISITDEYLESCGHVCLFFPKYNYELHPTERVWCMVKRLSKQRCSYTMQALRRIIPESLATVTTDDIKKHFRKTKGYEMDYRNGTLVQLLKRLLVKIYKSHRRFTCDLSAT
jgi:transposase